MVRASLAALCVFLLLPASAGAAFPQDGKRWRQVTETTGLTSAQIAAVCPADGESRCSGMAGGRDLTGWIWATDAQVIALMGHYEPSLLTADPPSVGGPEFLFQAITFLDDMRPTFFFSGYPPPTPRSAGGPRLGQPGSAGISIRCTTAASVSAGDRRGGVLSRSLALAAGDRRHHGAGRARQS